MMKLYDFKHFKDAICKIVSLIAIFLSNRCRNKRTNRYFNSNGTYNVLYGDNDMLQYGEWPVLNP